VRRRLGRLGAALALSLFGCAPEADRKGALVDGLIQMAATGEPVEAARARTYFEQLGVAPPRRFEVASTRLEDGRQRETIEIEVEPRDCITPAMIRDRTGVAYSHLPSGPPPLLPPLFGVRRAAARPRLPSPGIEFPLDTRAYRVVLAIAGDDLKADACVWSFTLRRISQDGD
jgi:hypothetical protein